MSILIILFSGTGDCWSRLASLVNNLEKFQEHHKLFLNEPNENDPGKSIKLSLLFDIILCKLYIMVYRFNTA